MQFPEARLVVGGTEGTIESRISKGAPPRAYLSAASIAELYAVDDGAEQMSLGACAPLSAVEQLCASVAAARPGGEGEAARAIKSMLRWFASTQIRNVACLGGNLATASPISDMVPVLSACGATLTAPPARRLQEPRTEAQQASYDRALGSMSVWYAHVLTTCYRATSAGE